jgi:hypothetical protein
VIDEDDNLGFGGVNQQDEEEYQLNNALVHEHVYKGMDFSSIGGGSQKL